MKNISIFTDGSSRGNPGPGGWGVVIVVTNNDEIKIEKSKTCSRPRSGIKNISPTTIGDEKAQVTELGGGDKHTTNNKMELTAVIHGLNKVADNMVPSQSNSSECSVKVFSDSMYVINGITKWVHGWKNNGWKTKTKDDVSNVDLWKSLDSVVNTIGAKNISWEYVGGHIGVAGNERCDEIATGYADGDSVQLYQGDLFGYKIANILDVSHDVVKLKVKKTSSVKSNAKAYSYVSSVNNKIEIHHSWVECEKRVKGAKGARFKKSFSAEDEKNIRSQFGGM